ncbi:uncharacterized protein JCM10292_002251 [Rhodotorula paludigena]|uniref:uncharacterized protein n=1 Tax=Rhodotorula paludigena TaxID=86838 RepID=UPI00317E0B0B
MCAAHAIFAYGITVTTPSLVNAADRWPSLQGPFRFFDLIALRKRRDTLSCSIGGPTTAASLPIELWDVARHRLVDSELKDAALSLAEELHCHSSDGSHKHVWEEYHTGGIAPCYYPDVINSIASLQRIHTLLSEFSLHLATDEPIRADMPSSASVWWDAKHDPDTALFVVLPSKLSKTNPRTSPFTITSECGEYGGPKGQSIYDVSLEVPKNAEQCFSPLLRLLHVVPVDVSDGALAHLCAENAGLSDNQLVLRSRRFEVLDLTEVKPSWKLFVVDETSW